MKSKEIEEKLAQRCEDFRNDPYGFVRYIFDWGQGELRDSQGPDDWQRDVLNELGSYCHKIQKGENPGALQLAVASGHGIGKSALVAWIIGWFMSTRSHPQIVVTANTETQLTTKTWRTLARWHKLMLNSHWFDWTATKFTYKQHPGSWYAAAVPWSENNADAFAGTHDRNVLVIFDEASNIHDVIWEKIDGAMSTRGAMWVCFGNPTKNVGRFYECFHDYKKWWVTRQIDSRSAKWADKVWVQRFIEQFGLEHDRTRYQILGQFPSKSTRQLISTDAVDRCMKHEAEGWEYQPKLLGCDIARFGENASVLTYRQGRKVSPQIVLPKQDLMTTAAFIAQSIKKEKPSQVFVDGAGLGAGVVDRLRQLGFSVVDVNGGNQSRDPAYLNHRAEMWCAMRDAIEAMIELPSDRDLKRELTVVQYDYTDKGRIRLDRKEDIMTDYNFSPDRADSLALTYAFPVPDNNYRREDIEPEAFIDS